MLSKASWVLSFFSSSMSKNDDDALAGLGSQKDDGTASDNNPGDRRTSQHRRRSTASDDDVGHGKKSNHHKPKSHRRSHRDSKSHKSKRHRRYEDDGNDDSRSSSSTDDESSVERHRHWRLRDDKKHSKKNKDRAKDEKRKKKRKKDKAHDWSNDATTSTTPTFGQYGILKPSDMGKMQRSFEIWLSEIHGVHLSSSNIPKYELQQYFDTYREDFNTATLPHVKYYNYDKWELEEHNRLRQNEAMQDRSSTVLEDERNHAKKLQLLAKQKEQAAMQLVAASMNSSKIADMQQQKQLQAQMQVAFKMGDSETYRKLKEKLQPLDK
jgi:hypothetical protein